MAKYPAELRRAVLDAMLEDGLPARRVVELLRQGKLPGYPRPFEMTATGARLWARQELERRALVGDRLARDRELDLLAEVLAGSAAGTAARLARAVEAEIDRLREVQTAGGAVDPRRLVQLAAAMDRAQRVAAQGPRWDADCGADAFLEALED
jgi:hypothetical protein